MVKATLAGRLAITQPHAHFPLGRMRERIRWARKIIHKVWDEGSVISTEKKNTNEWCKDNHSPAPRNRVVGLTPSQSTATIEQLLPTTLKHDIKRYGTSPWPLWVSWVPCNLLPIPCLLTEAAEWCNREALIQLKLVLLGGEGEGRGMTRCGMREHFLRDYCIMYWRSLSYWRTTQNLTHLIHLFERIPFEAAVFSCGVSFMWFVQCS